ncbi:MAG: hypothetical protein ACRDH8_00530 [Actinomycetota bacterium]
METADLRALVRFEEGEVVRSTVLESERLWAQLVCVDVNRSYGPVSDQNADAVFVVIAGETVLMVDRRRKRMGQWGAVLVPAGAQATATNASPDPLVLLVITAPPPGAGPG